MQKLSVPARTLELAVQGKEGIDIKMTLVVSSVLLTCRTGAGFHCSLVQNTKTLNRSTLRVAPSSGFFLSRRRFALTTSAKEPGSLLHWSCAYTHTLRTYYLCFAHLPSARCNTSRSLCGHVQAVRQIF